MSWELDVENQRFNFCVGVLAGGHPPANFSYTSKYAQWNSKSFDIIVVTEGGRGKGVSNENRPKIENYGGWNCVGWDETK